jgi:hypothetical protein
MNRTVVMADDAPGLPYLMRSGHPWCPRLDGHREGSSNGVEHAPDEFRMES